MSSRKKRQAVRATREEIRAGRTPTEEATPGQGERLAAAVERRRREAAHAQEQVQLRAARRDIRQPMDRFDTGNTEARWDYAVLHVAHQVDALGAPLLRDAFAAWCDDQRGARFVTAWRELLDTAPAPAAALWMVLWAGTDGGHDLADAQGALAAEEAAAMRAGVPAVLVRRRSGAAIRVLRELCQGDMPPNVREYARVRGARWRAEGDARVSDLTFR